MSSNELMVERIVRTRGADGLSTGWWATLWRKRRRSPRCRVERAGRRRFLQGVGALACRSWPGLRVGAAASLIDSIGRAKVAASADTGFGDPAEAYAALLHHRRAWRAAYVAALYTRPTNRMMLRAQRKLVALATDRATPSFANVDACLAHSDGAVIARIHWKNLQWRLSPWAIGVGKAGGLSAFAAAERARWMGVGPGSVAAVTDGGGRFGEAGWEPWSAGGGTPNQKYVRFMGLLLRAVMEPSEQALQAAATWIDGWSRLEDYAVCSELGSVYQREYTTASVAVLALSAVPAPIREQVRTFLDGMLRSEAAWFLQGDGGVANMREKATPQPALTWFLGGLGATERRDPHLCALAGLPADYVLPPDVVDIAFHPGVTTAEERMCTEGPFDARRGPVNPLRRVFTFRNHLTRTYFSLSCIFIDDNRIYQNGLKNSPERNSLDPPVWSKLVVRGPAASRSSAQNIHRIWLSSRRPAPRFGSPAFSDPTREWEGQYRNIVVSTYEGLTADRFLYGPLPFDEASEYDRRDDKWCFVRFGGVYIAIWIANGYELHGRHGEEVGAGVPHTDVYVPAEGSWPTKTTSTIQSPFNGAPENASILAVYPAESWPDFAACKRALRTIAPEWNAASRTLHVVLPTVVPSSPTELADVDFLSVSQGPRRFAGELFRLRHPPLAGRSRRYVRHGPHDRGEN